jgi:hypothetical protein
MGEVDPRAARYRQAYLAMASFYRPQAPSDGFGAIQLTAEQCRDQGRLEQEATEYAIAFNNEENIGSFCIGVSNYRTNKAFIWTIEAARCLAGGGDIEARKLLRMAVAEINLAIAGSKSRECV